MCVQVRGWSAPVQAAPLPDVRVHDQLYPQAEAPAREVHDEQCPREFHNTAGGQGFNLPKNLIKLILRPEPVWLLLQI